MMHPEPPGTTFFDSRSQRRLLFVRKAGHELDGWLCYHSASAGQWVALRRATGRDLLSIQQAARDQTMDSTELLIRTPAETVERMGELAEDPCADLHGVERSRLLESLPFEDAQKFLKAGTSTAEKWEVERTKNRASVIGQIRGYLNFAWEKANQCRGLSAQRSLSHFKGLLWLLGPECDELREWIGSPHHYQWYGKPALVQISELVGLSWRHPEGPDNDEWRDSEDGDFVTADVALEQGAAEPGSDDR